MSSDIAGLYVINLDSRTERWELFCEGRKTWEAAFGQPLQRLSAVAGVQLPGYGAKPWFTERLSEKRKRSWGGKAGCILSHRNAIQAALAQQLDNVLIVEDDSFLTEEMVQAWRVGLQELVANLPVDWAVVNLCTFETISPYRVVAETHGIKLVEAGGSSCAVAYLLNGRIFRRLLEELPDESSIWRWVARNKVIDRWYSRNLMRFGRVYFFAPAIVGHRPGPSDISMSAENAGDLDFSLRDLKYVQNDRIFALLWGLRRGENYLRSKATLLRYGAKRIFGY